MNAIETLADQSDLLGDREALREAFRADGVLCFPGLLDETLVAEVREQVTDVLLDVGWVSDRELTATGNVRLPGQPGFGEVYTRIQSLEVVHRYIHESPLPALVASLFDEPVFGHPGRVLRVAPPDPEGRARTNPHQDFAVLQTTADTVTAWIPLTEAPPERGGLKVRPRSHHEGFLRPNGEGYGDFDVFLDLDEDTGWATRHWQPGDVLLFHGLTVHAAHANHSARCRMSMDVRWQPVAEPIMAATLRPNRPREVPGWDVLTRGWSGNWVAVPDDVVVHRPPEGTTFAEMIAQLTVPPSRFVDAERPT